MKLTETDKRQRFFTLKRNGSVLEYAALEDAFNSAENEYIVVDKYKGASVSNAYYEWRLSDYIMYEPASNKINLNYNGWSIEKFNHVKRDSNILDFEVTIADPQMSIRIIKLQLRQARKHDNVNAHDCDSISIALNTLKEYSVHSSWAHVDVLEDNKKLKKEVELVGKRNKELNELINKKVTK
jgi:hypothetical protein